MTVICPLCWADLPDEDALRLHVAVEDDRLYDLLLPTPEVGESE